MINYSYINIPPVIENIIFKDKNNNINMVIYNNNKKMIISLDEKKFKFDPETNSLLIIKNFLNYEDKKNINKFHNFLKSWDMYFFNKIKFKGKGFRIRFFKKLRLVKFFFGKSHKSYIFYKKTIVKRINKYKFLIKNINKSVLMRNKKMTTNIRPMNLYTLRGIRCTRQIIGKRKGKKGTYI